MTSAWMQRALDFFPLASSARRRRKSSARPAEPLEARLLLTARVWDGGSVTSDRLTNRFNWEGNIAPKTGDDLIFPDSIRFTDRGLNNDFSTGKDFRNMTFEGEGYLIRGNRMDLTGDITYAPRSDIALNDTKLNLDISFLAGNHRIILASDLVENPELEFNGSLSDVGTGSIEISGDGDVVFGGDQANFIDSHAIVVDNPGITEVGLQTELILNKPDNKHAIDGALDVGSKAKVRVQFDIRGLFDIESRIGQIDPSSDVTVRDEGVLDIARETLRDLTLNNGSVEIDAQFSDGTNEANDIEGSLTLGSTVFVGAGNSKIIRIGNTSDPRIQLGSKTTFDVSDDGALILRVPLAGSDLQKTGNGSLLLEPVSNANAYDETFVLGGDLFIGGQAVADDRTVIPGDLHVSGKARALRDFGNEAIADSARIFLDAGARFEVNRGVEERIAELHADLSTVQLRDAGTDLIVVGRAEFTRSTLRSTSGARGRFSGPISLDHSLAFANLGTLSFRDVTMTAGRVLTQGDVGSVTLGEDLVVNADPESSEIEGKLILTQGNHDFLIADGSAASDLEVAADISDGVFGATASIIKKGAGRALFRANNTYRGTTTIVAGTLAVNGQHSLSQDVFTTVNNGTLTGKGLVNRINQTGGVLAAGFGVGRFTAAESAFLGDQTRFLVQINGPNVAQFDQLKTGTLTLGSAAHPKLDVRLGFTPTVGQQFKIIDVTGTQLLPANQVFRDLAGNALVEGAAFQLDGFNFTITYKGGNGNDVVITRNTPPAFKNITITPVIIEGQKVLVAGHITEPDPGHTFFLDVNWGDGSAMQTFRFAPGTPLDIQVSHRYHDDPTGTNNRYNVELHWHDQFGGTNGARLSTVVRNAAPKILVVTASLPPLKVGVPITIQGLISDEGTQDALRAFVQWESNGKWHAVSLPAGATTFSFQHTYAISGLHQVTLQLIDDDLDFDQLKVVFGVV